MRVIRTDQPESKPTAAPRAVFQTYETAAAAPNSRRRKVILASAAAGLIALIFTAIFFGYPLPFHHLRFERGMGEAPAPQAPASAAEPEGQPLVFLDMDLRALRRELQTRLPLIADDPRWRFASAVLDTAGLLRAKLFLYPDPENRLLPVVVLQGNNAADLKKGLLRTDLWKHILLPAEEETYRFSRKALEIASASGFPAEIYRVWFHTGWLVCAPVNQSQLWKDGQKRWRSFSVARFFETLGKPVQLAGLAVRVPQDLPPGWTQSLIPDSLDRSDPASMQTAEAAAGFLGLLDRSIQQIDAMAGAFRFVGQEGRWLQYAQWFRRGSDGISVFSRLQSGDNLEDRTSIGAIFSKLLRHDRLNTTVELQDNRLTVDLQWQADDDQVLLQSMIEAVFGSSRSDNGSGP